MKLKWNGGSRTHQAFLQKETLPHIALLKASIGFMQAVMNLKYAAATRRHPTPLLPDTIPSILFQSNDKLNWNGTLMQA